MGCIMLGVLLFKKPYNEKFYFKQNKNLWVLVFSVFPDSDLQYAGQIRCNPLMEPKTGKEVIEE